MQTEVSHAASRRYDCPQCGAPVPFRSSIAVSAVCEHCRSVVVRKDFAVESFGTMAELPPDLSPLQLGTKGHWNGRAFVLVGRLRLHWQEGSWNEWCADFGNGTLGWLAEAMGFFMVSFAHSSAEVERLSEPPPAGASLRLAGDTWTVTDVKKARCVAAEGELPFPVMPDAIRLGIDLTGRKGEFGSIELTEAGNAFFVGEYAQFEDLNFTELRGVPGWTSDAEITRQHSEALPCPQCGAPVNLRAEGLSMSAVCGSCGTIVDSSRPVLKEIGKVAGTTLRLKPVLPIGTRGMLRGDPWEVIGFTRRKDRWCSWDEFLLFNPWLGFRYLVTYNGHWSLVRLLPGHHTEERWNDERHALYAQEEAKTTDVLGEFYWRVKVGERVLLSDYISPPSILSREYNKQLNEIAWSGGEYIPHTEVAEAFKAELRQPTGIYLNQPNPRGQRWREIRTPFIFVVLAYVLIQILCLGYGTKTRVLSTALTYQPGVADKTLVTPSFRLTGGAAPLNISSGTNQLPLGTYLALKGALVNADTQQTTPLALPMTAYDGMESMQSGAILPAVPSGNYYFRFEPDASASVTSADINLVVTRGGIFWSNFFLGLLGILVWPLWLRAQVFVFEKQRWMDSEYGNPN